MTENEITYWAFLSHSQQDNCEQRPDAPGVSHRCWGNWLRDALKTFPIPAEFAGQANARAEIIPERIEPVFQDQEEAPENATLSDSVRQALEKSRCLIVICSPRSAKSLHVNEAVRYFKQLGRGHRILPLIIDGTPHASDESQPGLAPDDECFVPALRHPVKPDGTLDTTRRDRGFIFADARYGHDKRETLAQDDANAETNLETAKIQLLAGLLGVGFNGLWGHELKRRLAEAQFQAREAQQQLQAARAEVQAAQNQVLAIQNLPQDVQSQIQAAQSQAHEAKSQLEAARSQAREAQNQFLAIQNQVEEARSQTRAAESKILAAQQEAQEAQNQLAAARLEVQAAQDKVLAVESQPPAAPSPMPEAPGPDRELQSQLEAARNLAQAAEGKVLAAQEETRVVQNQVQEFQTQAREAQAQLEAARGQIQAAQDQARDTQRLLEAAGNPVIEAQQQVQAAERKWQEAQNQAQAAQQQLEAARNEIRTAQDQAVQAQEQSRATQNQVQEFQNQIRETQSQFEAASQQAQAAQAQVQATQTQAQSQIQAAQGQVLEAQNQVQEIQNKSQSARRLARVFAVLAVLALMAAGTVASLAFRQHKVPAPAPSAQVVVSAPEVTPATSAPNKLDQEQIKQALQKISAAGQAEHQQQPLDDLAARIPAEEIPETLKVAATILTDGQRRHFQEQLLGNWMKTDLPAAFDCSRQLTNLEDRQLAWAKLIPALAADNPTNTLAQLNEVKPAPGEASYTLLFQCWAAKDPVQAIEQRQQLPDQDADGQILAVILTAWAEQQPEAALSWLAAQPDAETLPGGTWRNTMIAALFDGWAAKDLAAATAACQQLSDGAAKEKAGEYILSRQMAKDPAAAAATVKNLPPGDYRQKAIAELCPHWADTDAPAALAWAQSLPAEAERNSAVNQVVAGWAHHDPQAAMQFAQQHPELPGALLGEIAGVWSQRDLTATTNWVATLPDGENKEAVLLALARANTERAPQLAATFCTQLTTNQPAVVQAIATALAGKNVTNAVAWARGLTNTVTQQAALTALAEIWAQQDPQGMATYAIGLPAGEAQAQYLTAACRQLARHDWPGTVALLAPLADAALRQNILEQLSRACDLPRLNQAAKWIAALPAGADQQAAIKGLLATWTPADPEAAVNWLRSFPETNAQPEQVQTVIKSWAQPEPAVAAKWLANLPAGTASEEMSNALLAGAVVKYPEFAAQWTQGVTDEAQRQKYQVQLARLWLKADPAAAVKWLDTLALPEEIKQSVKAPLPR